MVHNSYNSSSVGRLTTESIHIPKREGVRQKNVCIRTAVVAARPVHSWRRTFLELLFRAANAARNCTATLVKKGNAVMAPIAARAVRAQAT